MAFEFSPKADLKAQALAVINYIQGSGGAMKPADAIYAWQMAAKDAGAGPSRENLEDMHAMVWRWRDHGKLPGC